MLTSPSCTFPKNSHSILLSMLAVTSLMTCHQGAYFITYLLRDFLYFSFLIIIVIIIIIIIIITLFFNIYAHRLKK